VSSERKIGTVMQRGAIDDFFSVKDAYLIRKFNLSAERESSTEYGKRPKTLHEIQRSLLILKGTNAVRDLVNFSDLLTSANVSEQKRYEIFDKFSKMFTRGNLSARHVLFALAMIKVSKMSDEDVKRLMFMEAI